MYPYNYLALFPPSPRSLRAFVAMSFDARLDSRWCNVIQPAISAVAVRGQALEPFRVDLSRASDAILTEILQAIGESTIIVADITALNELDGKAVRNANVMYEVGIAHASRLPEEVLLLRSDGHRLDFDITGVRVHSYDPDRDPNQAKRALAELIAENLRSVDSRRRIAVKAALQRLTVPALEILLRSMMAGSTLTHPKHRTFREVLGGLQQPAAIELLLELGALSSTVTQITPELLERIQQEPGHDPPLLSYRVTPFGEAMIEALGEQMGLLSPELRPHMEQMLGEQTESLPSA